ncbi:MAG: alginate export family protein [Henriciella sp.]|uniref:alginate export family protein n=1 Tax=Henriciella sp. TaxID=1968823 RepID=UPI003C75084F
MGRRRLGAPRHFLAPLIACGSLISPAVAEAQDWSVDLEGATRLRVDGYDNPVFGLQAAEDFMSLQYRATGKASAKHSSGFSAVLELGYYDEAGRSPGPRRTDRNHGDILQAYLSYTEAFAAWDWDVRLGRQRNPQGQSRLNAGREAPNAIRSFDGVSLSASRGDVRLSLFALRPVKGSFGSFDDQTDYSEGFWGGYLSNLDVAGTLHADLYYFGRKDEQARWAQGAGSEERHSIGSRIFGDVAGWTGNIELIYQFGQFESAPLKAWGAGWEISRPVSTPGRRLDVGLRGNVVSGDKDPDDPSLQTFSAIYPRFTYYSPSATLAPTNSWDVQVFSDLELTSASTLAIAAGLIERLEPGDDVYAVPYVPLGFADGPSDSAIGKIISIEYQNQITPKASVTGSLTYIRAGPLLRSSGGEDITHFAITLSNRF